ncbi:MAG: (Fe-S)-binding protein [Candidatus Bathyarchaeota archaeon]|nr:MAG: (Fe-S)-binding protein [Candidatus Bathyarchaeota archaeon]
MKQKKFLDNFGRSESLWMYACSRCGECVDVCPVYEETADKYTAPGFKIKKMRGLLRARGSAREESVKKVVEGLYECTLCGRCWSVCPNNYDLVALWEKARESAVETGFGLNPHTEMIEALKAENNIFKRPHTGRRDWTKGLRIPEKEKADTVYFIGCLMSYRGQLKPAAKAMATILNAAGENWTILKGEVCCGAPLRFSGGTKHMEELMDANVKAIESTGARKIVFSCPGCYRVFWQEYSKLLGDRVRLVHAIELIDSYVKSGKIKLKDKTEERITYHDPCELSRLSGVIEEPRHVFANLTTQFVELPGNKFNVKCCGGGGLYKAIDLDKSREIAKKRVTLAEEIGATTLTTACPSCYMTISQAARLKKSNVKVIDFAEAIAPQIE